MISLFDLSAIEIAKCGMPCKKFIVPSIGSIIQVFFYLYYTQFHFPHSELNNLV